MSCAAPVKTDRANGFFAGALLITLGFVALRFLITPVRIKVITTVLSPEDYGVVTLLSMTAHGLCLIVSAGGFELLLRRLPGMDNGARLPVFRSVVILSVAGALAVSLVFALLWNRMAWLNDMSSRISAPAAVVLFLLFLVVQQRIHYLLGCRQHFRARAVQLLWGDFWFLPVLLMITLAAWRAETVVWTWSGWLILALLLTWRWVPTGFSLPAGTAAFSLKETLKQSIPILPVLISDWVFRLTGHFSLLIHRDAATMAFYALAMNLALTGQAAGVPLMDICCVDLGKVMARPDRDAGAPSRDERRIFSRGVRHALAVSIPLMLVLLFMPNDLIAFLSGPAFQPAANLLPWASAVPMLLLFNLLLARVLMLLGRSFQVAAGSVLGALAALVLCILAVPSFGAKGALVSISCAAAVVDVLFIVELRAWRWTDRSFIHGPGLLAGALLLTGIFACIRIIPGAPFLRLVIAGITSLLVLIGTGCLRRSDFQPVKPAGEQDDAPDGVTP